MPEKRGAHAPASWSASKTSVAAFAGIVISGVKRRSGRFSRCSADAPASPSGLYVASRCVSEALSRIM
jgi:hypothetical protein